MPLNTTLQSAVTLALAGEWDQSHRIVQEYHDHFACWIHAVLHKIEGDAWNSRYWYARTRGQDYEAFDDPRAELQHIARLLAEA